MRVLLAFLALTLAACSTALAEEPRKVSTQALIKSPASHRGELIKLENMRCISHPKSGFRCVAMPGGTILVVDGLVLGHQSGLSAAERLVEECTGTANLSRPICTFDVWFKPTAHEFDAVDLEEGSMRRLIVFTGMIDMAVGRSK